MVCVSAGGPTARSDGMIFLPMLHLTRYGSSSRSSSRSSNSSIEFHHLARIEFSDFQDLIRDDSYSKRYIDDESSASRHRRWRRCVCDESARTLRSLTRAHADIHIPIRAYPQSETEKGMNRRPQKVGSWDGKTGLGRSISICAGFVRSFKRVREKERERWSGSERNRERERPHFPSSKFEKL
jgi:hypothetical protein